jgi:hypothetical protein
VIPYLNNNYDTHFGGDAASQYYGINNLGQPTFQMRPTHFACVLTIQEFKELATEWIPQVGEFVDVMEKGGTTWKTRMFAANLGEDHAKGYGQYICVAQGDETAFKAGGYASLARWFCIRKHTPAPKVNVTINGDTQSLNTISKEQWIELWEQVQPKTC